MFAWWKIDYGKTIEDTCLNEVKEETNLDISNLRFLFYQNDLPSSLKKMHVITLYFSAKYSGTIQINNESRSFMWANPHELSKYKIAFKNNEGIKKYLELKK